MTPLDDIPEAARDTPLGGNAATATGPGLRWAKPFKRWLWLVLAIITAILVGSVATWYQAANGGSSGVATPLQRLIGPAGMDTDPSAATQATLDRAVQLAPTSRTLLGHRAFAEAPEDDLVALSTHRNIRLRTAAAAQFEAMTQAASREGVRIVPLSGFRTRSEQEALFFGVKAQRGQNAETRAEVSAPPGYSEHHTGYAIDVGDASQPGTNLRQSFEDTRAYRWMEANAARYSFELSFPPGNFQGVSFEPWHWRFVGDIHSLETFYQRQPSE